MKEHENRRITQTKRYIKESLVLLLGVKPIQKISIKELCDKAGINRSTFYNHYKSQYDIFQEIESDYLEEIDRLCPLATEHNPEDALVQLLQYIEANRNVSKLLLQNTIDPEFTQKACRLGSVQQSIQHIDGSADPAIHKELVDFCLAGCHVLIRNWIEDGADRKKPEELAQTISILTGNAIGLKRR